MSPADSRLHVAFFQHKADNQPHPMQLTWERLAERLMQHAERAEKDGPLWSPAQYPPGATRSNKAVLGLCAAVGDFDNGISWEEVKERLEKYEYIAHSTHSFDPEHPKFRIVIPFSRPVAQFDWAGIKARIDHHVFGLATDPAAKDASRAYYLPSCPPESLRFAERHQGEWLDPRALADAPQQPRNGCATPGNGPTNTGRVPLGKGALDFVANGASIGEQRVRAVAAGRNYLSAGYSVEDTAAALWRGFQACRQEPDREPWGYEDAEKIARSLHDNPGPDFDPFPDAQPQVFRREGLGYIYEPKGTPVRIVADYLSHRGDDITAELVVNGRLPGVPSKLYRGRLNLCAPNSKRSLAGDLEDMCHKAVEKETWRSLLEHFSQLILESEREGEPFQEIGSMPLRSRDVPRYLVDRLLPYGKPALLYGPGGVGKGWIATGIACASQLGLRFAGMQTIKTNVLYLDWEDDAQTLDERVKAVSRGMGIGAPPRIGYRRCNVPLPHQVNQISRYVADHQIGLVIVDSVGLAAGSAGDRGTYEQVALTFFAALKQIGQGITWLLIDHVSEAGRQNTQTPNKAYGSVYKMNEARMAWEIRKDQEAGASSSHIGLYNTKSNHGPLQLPIGLKIDFSAEDVVRVERQDVGESEELSKPLRDPDKIWNALETGPRWERDLAEVIGKSDHQTRTTCGRLRDKGLAVRLPDGRWARATRRLESAPNVESEEIML